MKIVFKIARNVFLTAIAIVAIYNSAPKTQEVVLMPQTFNADVKVSSN